ncbi:MAG: C39 family peptidase [Patescibacteria group bacterium]|nr:C39 family peptidase [Patescibacteria group bacterium]
MMNNQIIKLLLLTLLILTGCQPAPVVQVENNENSNNFQTSTITAGAIISNVSSTPAVTDSEIIVPNNKGTTSSTINQVPVLVDGFIDLKPQFASQAPFGVWDELHGEACEEASMIIAYSYVAKKPLTTHTMEQGILDLVNWERANSFGQDLTVVETSKILREYFKVSADEINNPNVELIKSILRQGKLIIMPAAGRLLGNPYFQTPGPIYHMLVIRGYDDKTGEFITNDPGTRRGDGYRYQYDVLLNAIHDWNHQLETNGMTDEEMALGVKRVIAVY